MYLGNRKGVFVSIPVKKRSNTAICKIYDFQRITYTYAQFAKACMMYSFWDTEWDRNFWDNLCPFIHPLKTWKIKILKKWKNAWRHYPFTNVYHKWRSYIIYKILKMMLTRVEFKFLNYQLHGNRTFPQKKIIAEANTYYMVLLLIWWKCSKTFWHT